MSSLPALLDDISTYISISVGIIELVIGNVGNLLAIVLFNQYPFSSTRASLILIVIALLATIYLDLAVVLRVLAGFRRQPDTTFGSDVLCRLFLFVLLTTILSLLTLLVLVSIDRYEFVLVVELMIEGPSHFLLA